VTEEIRRKLKRKEVLPLLADILKLSEGGNTYQWMCRKMLKCVVGCSVWGWRYYKENISKLSTMSDESFLILTLENNWARWMDESKLQDEDEEGKQKISEALYTNSGNSRVNGKGSSRRFQGWSREGYCRFNKLYAMVKEDRARRAIFENDLRKIFEMEHAERNRIFSEEDEEEEEIFPANDMEGVKQPAEILKISQEEDNDKNSDVSDDNDDEY
jgi:hypothetical protein